MLNSEWIPASINLKKYIGLEWKLKTVKVADIQSGREAVPSPNTPVVNIHNNNENNNETNSKTSSKNNNKKDKNKQPLEKSEKNGNNQNNQINDQVNNNNNNNNNTNNDQSEVVENNEVHSIAEDVIENANINNNNNNEKKQKQKKQKNNKNNNEKSESITENYNPYENLTETSLDLSDPNLYAEDYVVPADWTIVEKKSNKKSKMK